MSNEAGHFNEPASPETLERVAAKLRERNVDTIVVPDGSRAREEVLKRLPAGAEVHAGKSKTLQDIGVTPVLAEGGAYNYLRNVYLKMDRASQMREIRKLISAPDFMLGSVSAVTRDGILVAEVGKTDTVEQAEFRAKDRRKARLIGLYSALVGIVLAAAGYFLVF